MLKWRLLLGTLLIGFLAGLCILDARTDPPGTEPGLPGTFLMPVLLLLTVLATQEVLRLAAAAGIRPLAWTIHAGNLLLVFAQWLPVYFLYSGARGPWRYDLVHFQLLHDGNNSPLWAMALAVLMIFLGEMHRYERPGGTLAQIAVGVFCLVYVGLMLVFAVQIRLFWGVGALLTWIISVKMGDIGAYTVGRLFGRTKMSPTISPGKTIEGAAGAMLFAVVGAWIGFHGIVQWAPPYAEGPPGQPTGWFIFGVLMGAAGMLGDLAESLLKRNVGRKDSSDWMPGFGGVLNVLDSLLLSAPIAWFCWSLGIVGPGGGP